MTGFEITCIGARVASAVLIGVGIRGIALRRSPTGPRCPALWAGITLWLLVELAQSPVLIDVALRVPTWIWVGLLAAATSGALAFTLTLRVLRTRGDRREPGSGDLVQSAADDSKHIHEEAWS